MTGRLLDVSALPTDWSYDCVDGSVVEMRYLLAAHSEAIIELANSGLIKVSRSYGFALSVPIPHGGAGWQPNDWDEPNKFVAFVGGRGIDRDRYAANAVRKLRPWIRQASKGGEFDSTLSMRLFAPELFEQGVESQNADGTFPWGDYPWGGAAVISFPEFALAGAISGFSEIEDDFVCRMILGGLARLIIEGDGLLSD